MPAAPGSYGFTVAVPAADVAALIALIRQAYDRGGCRRISVAGKLWPAAQVVQAIPGSATPDRPAQQDSGCAESLFRASNRLPSRVAASRQIGGSARVLPDLRHHSA
jgi:hypothetical protein